MNCGNCENRSTIVGKVTVSECNRMYGLFRHLNALKDLGMIISAEDTELHAKYNKDLELTERQFQDWWDTMADKYQWPAEEGGHWEINFETCEIILCSN